MTEAASSVPPIAAKTRASLEIVRDVESLRAKSKAWQRAGKTVGVVPTMGGLHDGHLTLVRRALEQNNHVIVTVFAAA